jgi:DNA replication protein DnaC
MSTEARPRFSNATAERLANCAAGNDRDTLCGISLAGLAALIDPTHPANKIVTAKCTRCDATFPMPLFFSKCSACDDCRAKYLEADRLAACKDVWEEVCPPGFRNTDLKHADFPKAQWSELKEWTGSESLFFYGPSRQGKTRLALLMLKRAMLYGNKSIAALWPEDVDGVRHERDTRSLVIKWGSRDVLLLDDCLLSGATDERVSTFLKNLLDYRMRMNRHHIITSQVGSDDYKEQAAKFGKFTKSDEARIEALFARIRETCRVVPFVKPVAVGTDQHF